MTLENPLLDERVHRVIRDGAAAWPDVRTEPARLAGQLAAHMVEGASVDPHHHADLYLAAACAAGDPVALAAFEHHCMSPLDGPLRALVGDAHVSEVKQIVRHRVLVPRDGRPPRIVTYAGRSSLRGWVRACALRAGSTLLRQQRSSKEQGIDWLEIPVEFADPALAQLRRRFGPVFKEALESALAGISLRDRSVLRYAYLEGVSMDDIGRIYGVHRTTALRWLEAARRRVLSHVRRVLLARLGLAGPELESVLRDLHGNLELSLERILAAAEVDRT